MCVLDPKINWTVTPRFERDDIDIQAQAIQLDPTVNNVVLNFCPRELSIGKQFFTLLFLVYVQSLYTRGTT